MTTNRELLEQLDEDLEQLDEGLIRLNSNVQSQLELIQQESSNNSASITDGFEQLRNQIGNLRSQFSGLVREEIEEFYERKSEREFPGKIAAGFLQDQAIKKLVDPSYLMHCRWQAFVKIWMKVSALEEYADSDKWLSREDIEYSLKLNGFIKEQIAFMLEHVLDQGIVDCKSSESGESLLRWAFENPQTKAFIEELGFNW